MKFVCCTALRATACEHAILTVNCYEQDVIQIINAHYGRLDDTTCQSNIVTLDTECLFTRTRDVVYNRSVIIMLISICGFGELGELYQQTIITEKSLVNFLQFLVRVGARWRRTEKNGFG